MWKYHKQNFWFFSAFPLSSADSGSLVSSPRWARGYIGFAVEFFTSRCMKGDSFLLLSPLTSAWRWVETCVGLLLLWRNWCRRRGEQGKFGPLGFQAQLPIGKEERGWGEKGSQEQQMVHSPHLCCWSHPLVIQPGEQQASCAQSLRKGMSVINGKGPDTIKDMSAFSTAKPT